MKANELTQEDVQFINQMARTIKTTMRLPNPNVFFSWGAHDFHATLYDGMAGLQFTTNGFLHKGKVIVTYNEGADLFELYLFNADGTVKYKETDLYCDQLQEVIDRHVETTNADSDEYQTDIANEQYIFN